MSRSTRKTPIRSITTYRSERDDKQISTPLDDDGTLPESVKQLSDVWCMGKDGHLYWSADRQKRMARLFARRQGRGRKERNALEARLRHKHMGK